MGKIQFLFNLIYRLPFIEGHRRQIGIGAILAGAAIHGLQAATVYLTGEGYLPDLLVKLAPGLEAAGTYIAIIGTAFKDDAHLPGAKGR